MSDLLVLGLILAASTAAGLALLRALRATPADGDALLVGLAVGFGIAGTLGLGLAAAQALRTSWIALAGGVALVAGGAELVRGLRRLDRRRVLDAWPLLLVCAGVLAVEVVAMLAPPVGGDQTKYHLVYPRLYAAHGGLVDTPWTFWGQMQFLQNFLFAIAFALRGDVLARLLNGAIGVAAAFAVGRLVRRHLARGAGAIAATIFFTLPITFSLMTRAGADLGVVLYAVLATDSLLDWMTTERASDLRRAALLAGLAGASKVMGLLVPALVGVTILVVLLVRAASFRRVVACALAFGVLVVVVAAPCYVRNARDTGNPLYPFGYSVFGGRNWSRAASAYLADYYEQYQSTYAERRDDTPYVGLKLARFPWDLTMHPDSFENAARQSLDVGPFVLAFAPALLLVRRRRPGALVVAVLGIAYASVIAGAAWAHPRYVVPGVVLVLAAAVPASRALLGARFFIAVVALTIAGNLALTSRLLRPMWPDQLRVVAGRLRGDDFLRRYSERFAFWERANEVVPPSGRVLVLEKVPHPYYIERPFVLASYLEQGMIDYRRLREPDELAEAARGLGITHVAVDVAALGAMGDPFETTVSRLWRGFVAQDGDLVLRRGGFALYALKPATALAADGGDRHGS
jgi:hypothetical protein